LAGCTALFAHGLLTDSKYFPVALVKRRVPPYLRWHVGRILSGRRDVDGGHGGGALHDHS
jgi:hypothetical protein